MPTRFDHAVIVVRSLDRATELFRHLGFDAQPGGRHADGGTHNALIRFGLDYVELLSVYDEAAARANNSRGLALLDTLKGREAALVGFALATNEIEQEASRFTGSGNEPAQPHAMGRKRPDGQELTWRVASPGGSSFNKSWPFLIQWDTPDEQRLKIDRPGEHLNGANGWSRVTVATSNFEQTLGIYRNQLELDLLKLDISGCQTARTALLGLGRSVIALQAPLSDGPVQSILNERGEGPYALSFRVKDLKQTANYFKRNDIVFEQSSSGTPRITLAPAEALGVRIHFSE